MKQEILQNLARPEQLEKLYQANKDGFRKGFNELFPEIKEDSVAQTWQARLNYQAPELKWGSRNDWVFLIISILLAGFIAKIPQFTGIKEDFFFPRNFSFIAFPFLIAFFVWKQQLSVGRIIALSAILVRHLSSISICCLNKGRNIPLYLPVSICPYLCGQC